MAVKTAYSTENGRLVQESRDGVVTRYVSDTVGSVIQTRDASGSQTSSTTYWPFGELRTSTGSNPSPWWFVGTLGYYRDALSRLYVRARILRTDLSRWLTVDGLFPNQPAFQYAGNAPILVTDQTGLWNPACIGCGICLGVGALAAVIACAGSPLGFLTCVKCWCFRNPVACGIIVGACALACAVCVPAIIKLLKGLFKPGLIGLPAPAYAAGANASSNPCDPCLDWLTSCQAACSTFSGIYGGGWYRCCTDYCSQNYQVCMGRPVNPKDWCCYSDYGPNPTPNPFPVTF